jgi:hypothetical protein
MSRRPLHVVTTIDLPSGRTLEVVHSTDQPQTRVKVVDAPAADRDLCICEACGADLVEPFEWDSAGLERWRVGLYCPNCDHTCQGVFSQECVDRFDRRLDEATAAMIADLKRLEAARMSEDVEAFVAALNAGAILPEDF